MGKTKHLAGICCWRKKVLISSLVQEEDPISLSQVFFGCESWNERTNERSCDLEQGARRNKCFPFLPDLKINLCTKMERERKKGAHEVDPSF